MTNHLVFGGLLLSSITGKSSYVIQMHHAILPKNEQKYTYSKMIQKLCTFKLKWEKSFSHRYLAGLTGFYSRCINDNHSINQSTYVILQFLLNSTFAYHLNGVFLKCMGMISFKPKSTKNYVHKIVIICKAYCASLRNHST